jgi:hypothetical protein
MTLDPIDANSCKLNSSNKFNAIAHPNEETDKIINLIYI